jgi:hypothetical protein
MSWSGDLFVSCHPELDLEISTSIDRTSFLCALTRAETGITWFHLLQPLVHHFGHSFSLPCSTFTTQQKKMKKKVEPDAMLPAPPPAQHCVCSSRGSSSSSSTRCLACLPACMNACMYVCVCSAGRLSLQGLSEAAALHVPQAQRCSSVATYSAPLVAEGIIH